MHYFVVDERDLVEAAESVDDARICPVVGLAVMDSEVGKGVQNGDLHIR